MAFDRLLKRRGRNRGNENRPFESPQSEILGVNYSASPKSIPPNMSPFAQNADFGNPLGAISKAPGYEALFSSLGTGKVLGLHYWKHSTGGQMIAAWDKYFYLLSGGVGSIAKTSQADWEAGTRTHIDTTTSAGDMKTEIGASFSEADTLTTDFNGTHSNTVAISDTVTMAVESVQNAYTADVCNGGTVLYYPTSTWTAPGNAFDNSDATKAAQGDTFAGNYIGYDFGVSTTRHIRRIRIKHGASCPSSLKLQSSANGTAWTDVQSFSGLVNTDQIIDINASSANRYWRIYAVTASTFGWDVYEIEMMEYISTTYYYASGTYTHGAQNISSVKLAGANSITFNVTTPTNTSVTVQVRLSADGGLNWGSWATKNSGNSIVASGTDLTGYSLQWRALLATTDTTARASLNDVTVAFTAIYYSVATWISPVYDLGNVPLTATLSWTESKPANTAISYYARGSSSGTVFGDWQAVYSSGDSIPLHRYSQIKIVLTSTTTATPTISSILIGYTTSYTTTYRLDIGPLGRSSNQLTGNRVSMEDYEDWLLCADGLRPFIMYITTATQETDTAQAGTINTITLKAGASAVNDFYNNAFVTITGGAGAGKVRFISDYIGSTKVATVSVNWSNNLLTANESSLETSLPAGYVAAGAGAAISRDTTTAWHGVACLKVVGGTDAFGGTDLGSWAVTAGLIYIASAYIKGNAGGEVVNFSLYASDYTLIATKSVTLTTAWQRVSVTGTIPAGKTAAIILCRKSNDVVSRVWFMDGFQIEPGSSVTDWDLNPDATSTYSIGSAIKVRKAGIDPPASALTASDSGVAGSPNGTYYYKATYVNADGFESNPGPASTVVTVTSKKIDLSSIPVDSSTGNTTAKRRIYRTATGGAVYKYLTEIADNTTTTYQDNTADAALGALMLDNNNVPGNASIVYPFNSYVFYADGYDLWFSKAGAPDHVPNITGDIQVIPLSGRILDIKSNSMALILMGEDFVAPITSSTGFIFDSDPTVDTTTMKVVSGYGSLSSFSSSICIDPERRENLVFMTKLGLKEILPGMQESSLETIPLSYDIQPYIARAVNLDQSAGVFFGAKSYYLFSFEYLPDGGSATEYATFVCDFRTKRFYGPWTFGMSCYAIANNELYAGDAENGIVYRMFTGNNFAGTAINMITDLPVVSPFGESRTYDFVEFMAVVSADSDTTSTQVKPKVDDQEATVSLGVLTSTFTGTERPGHNSIRSRFYQIPLSQGHSLSHRIVDNSSNPLTIYEIITKGEALPLDD